MRLFLLALLLTPIITLSQVKSSVKWAFTAKKISAGVYEVHLAATIEAGWHTYSQTTPDGGPVPTSVKFTANPLIMINGTVKEIGKLEQKHEPIFGVDVKQYSNKVDFVQNVKLKAHAKTSVTGEINFMVCNDRECLPPSTVNFSVSLN
ncbi:MAG: hypothetical protein JST47_00840 [Bacteroidetes bacterium]|nr:hypothetical protein [Bacteroidota bacterium]